MKAKKNEAKNFNLSKKKNAQNWLKKGNAYYISGSLKEAIRAFDQAIFEDINCEEAYFQKGLMQMELKQFNNATSTFSFFIALNDKSQEAWKKLGIALFNRRKINEAVVAFQNSIELDENDAEPFFYLGKSFHKLNRMEESEINFRRALEIDPSSIQIKYYLANLYADNFKDKEAISIYKEIIKKVDSGRLLENAMFNLANTFAKVGESEKAVNEYKELLKIDGGNYRAYYSLGCIFENRDDDQALLNYRKSIETSPNFHKPYYNIACILLKADKLKEALDHFESAFKLGYKHFNYLKLIKNDPDLNLIKKNNEFKKLVRTYVILKRR